MGPKSSSMQGNDYESLRQDYEIVRQVDAEGLFFLKNKKTGGDYLLR